MKGFVSIYLDLFRFLAAMGVFLFHAGMYPLSSGILPYIYFNHELVVIFFVISGYVIAASAARPDRTLANYSADRLARLTSVVIPALVLTYFLAAIGSSVSPEICFTVSKFGFFVSIHSTTIRFGRLVMNFGIMCSSAFGFLSGQKERRCYYCSQFRSLLGQKFYSYCQPGS
jgi:peptidoglycan/LPS O-acetylase OafA/YrhL